MWRVSFVVCCEKEKRTRLVRGGYKGDYYVNKECEVGLGIIIKMLVCMYVYWLVMGRRKCIYVMRCVEEEKLKKLVK